VREFARREGIDLATNGIDPHNNVLDVPLQVASERNSRLSAYLDTLGPSGARYLRQSAGLSIHLDAGRSPGSRWRLLSGLSPYLTAIFATSRRYAGLDSGLQSYRAYCRRTLDPSRTGMPPSDGDSRDAYLEFALDAVDALRRRADGGYVSYRDWIASGEWSADSWERHLATLYPEVRPRGHFELCAIDSIPLRWLAAPIVLACGLTYDEGTATEAESLVKGVDDAVLWRAAGLGLHDSRIAHVCRELVELGLRGARSLGASFASAETLGVAREFCETYTLRARALADDPPAPPPKPAPRLVVINGALGFA
jgi:glutamate--cysteine ligase